MKEAKKKNEKIEILRALAIIAVVSVHTFNSSLVYADKAKCNFNIYSLVYMLRNISYWGVPVFIMITGYLFLSKERVISIQNVLKKYFLRMLIVLILFGTVYSGIEIFFNERVISLSVITRAVCNVICGNTWAHMWYMYLLLGIYLMLPFIKSAVDNIADKELIYTVVILFVFIAIVPCINALLNVKIGFYVIMSDYALLMLLLGNLVYRKVYFKSAPSLAGCSIIIIALISYYAGSRELAIDKFVFGEHSPMVILFAYCLFASVMSSIKDTNVLIKKILIEFADKSFGIYLVHMVFVNIVYQMFHFNPIYYANSWLIWYILFIIGNIILSYLVTFVMKKVPIINKLI